MMSNLINQVGGYQVIENVLSESELDNIVGAYDELFISKEAYDNGDLYDMASSGKGKDFNSWKIPQIMHPEKYLPQLRNTDLFKNISEYASEYFGSTATVSFAHAINKPPHCITETPWHQDAAFWRPELEYNSLSFWVPLQDVDDHNGCMRYAVGSQEFDVLPHQSVNNDITAGGFELREDLRPIFLQDVCSVPLSMGQAVAHCPYILHSSGGNHSNHYRRAALLLNSVGRHGSLKLFGS
ncbi:phytanoyl-CoA dioxygenase family protein [Enterovibrio nigricans]|uniref:Phytanoyl-CoA dioxygenase (PhyH) n=1 Tax=Enterovibrio nigricans DSM 22720 TaxID=1121868 RepID=A0A1T4VT42_9GAMM|nr:phytanoyl-CoA dioxygenase family protein [Enterovibrio nigricans]PKF48973.1 hypothetical protein AT251_22285 [Enterovibrio nigricans]SKA67998.1 Phytanoyl-CoA dioxygenase (PhyH) [Enterovibrio nigricans DSM 22720]